MAARFEAGDRGGIFGARIIGLEGGINDHPASPLDEFLPWSWRKPSEKAAEAAEVAA